MKTNNCFHILTIVFITICLNSTVYAQPDFVDAVADIESTLPVSLLNFSGKQGNGNSIVLQWQTSLELNNKGFELEYSKDNIEFNPIQWIASKHADGNSIATTSYNYTDFNAKTGTNFYRLNQIDKDGKSTLSKVVAVRLSSKDGIEIIKMYPNPSVNELNLSINSSKNTIQIVNIVASNGAIVLTRSYNIQQGSNLINMNVSRLQKGMYVLRLAETSRSTMNEVQFLKQ